MVDPRIMCTQHLFGEHVELHMFVGTINQGKSLDGYVENELVEVHNIKKRHKQLVKEMERRGMNHRSPLQKFIPFKLGKVPRQKSLKDLLSRCKECHQKFNGVKK